MNMYAGAIQTRLMTAFATAIVTRDGYDWIALAASLSLALVGVGGIFVAVGTLGKIARQTKATEDSAKTAERTLQQMADTSVRQLRAYLCIDAAALKFKQPSVPEAQVHIKNVGQTPAYDVRGWIHTWYASFPLQQDLPSPPEDFMMASTVLAPSGTSIHLTPEKPPLCSSAMAHLGTPLNTLYVYGSITYRDIFQFERHLKYRLIFGGSEGTHSKLDKEGNEIWILKPDTSGNEAD